MVHLETEGTGSIASRGFPDLKGQSMQHLNILRKAATLFYKGPTLVLSAYFILLFIAFTDQIKSWGIL